MSLSRIFAGYSSSVIHCHGPSLPEAVTCMESVDLGYISGLFLHPFPHSSLVSFSSNSYHDIAPMLNLLHTTCKSNSLKPSNRYNLTDLATIIFLYRDQKISGNYPAFKINNSETRYPVLKSHLGVLEVNIVTLQFIITQITSKN